MDVGVFERVVDIDAGREVRIERQQIDDGMGMNERELVDHCWVNIGAKPQQGIKSLGSDRLTRSGRRIWSPHQGWRVVRDVLNGDATHKAESFAEVVVGAESVAPLVHDFYTGIYIVQKSAGRVVGQGPKRSHKIDRVLVKARRVDVA